MRIACFSPISDPVDDGDGTPERGRHHEEALMRIVIFGLSVSSLVERAPAAGGAVS